MLYTGAQWAKKLGLVQGTSLNRNTGLLTILSSFALGTFVAASTTGKELVHLLHPMFQTAGTDTTTNTTNNTNDYSSTTTSSMSYQNRILLASNKTNESVDDDDEKRFDPQRLRELRVTRRKSLMDNLHTQGNGLSGTFPFSVSYFLLCVVANRTTIPSIVH